MGLKRDVVHNLTCALKSKRVLLLGAGGAARGALLPFLQQGRAVLYVAKRGQAKAQALVREVAGIGAVQALGYGDLDSGLPCDVVLNAASVSLRGELPPVPAEVFAANALAYELAYGKALTPRMRLAQGARRRSFATRRWSGHVGGASGRGL